MRRSFRAGPQESGPPVSEIRPDFARARCPGKQGASKISPFLVMECERCGGLRTRAQVEKFFYDDMRMAHARQIGDLDDPTDQERRVDVDRTWVDFALRGFFAHRPSGAHDSVQSLNASQPITRAAGRPGDAVGRGRQELLRRSPSRRWTSPVFHQD